MPVFQLNDDILFPPVHYAEADGLLAIGGDLRPERLLVAYAMGIFPWYNDDDPILWWSPDPRMVLYLDELHLSRSMHRTLKRGGFTVRFDTSFEAVVRGCAKPGPGREATWISEDIVAAYCRLHDAGFAHSVECWRGDHLAGGLYGVSLGRCFFGESMFSRESNASKTALAVLVAHLRRWEFDLIDCQIANDHLARLGGRDIPRDVFVDYLEETLQHPTRRGAWTTAVTPAAAARDLKIGRPSKEGKG